MANAEKFAGGPEELVLRRDEDRVVIEVSDPSPVPPVVRLAGGDAESGRGLLLVQAISSEWDYCPRPGGGKIVRCSVPV